MDIATKMIVWFFFTVVISVIPIVGLWFLLDISQPPDWPWSKLFGHGEMFLITTVLSAAAAGDLWMTPVAGGLVKLIKAGISGFCISISVICSLCYGIVCSQMASGIAGDALTHEASIVTMTSCLAFLFSLINCGFAVIMSVVQEER